jgi:hypothetical protein
MGRALFTVVVFTIAAVTGTPAVAGETPNEATATEDALEFVRFPAPEPALEQVHLHALLQGGEVVPGPGDPDGFGFTGVYLRQGGEELCYFVDVVDTDVPLTAGIYEGGAGVAGPLVIDLDIATNGPEACIPVDSAAAEAVFADSFGHYAQVTTAEFPDGAVRGQFSADVFGDLSFEPRTGPPGTRVTVESVTPCPASGEVHVAMLGGLWGGYAAGTGPEGIISVDFFAEDFVVETTASTAPDGSWTVQLAVPDGAREGEAFFAAVCFDAATRTFVGYLSFDVFRITPLAKAAAVRVEPSFTG